MLINHNTNIQGESKKSIPTLAIKFTVLIIFLTNGIWGIKNIAHYRHFDYIIFMVAWELHLGNKFL